DVQMGEPVRDMLDAGQARNYALRVPYRWSGAQVLALTLHDRRNADQVYAWRSFPVSMQYTPVALVIERPRYRNSIYATEKLDSIEARVKLSVAPEELKGARAAAALTRVGEERPVAATTIRDVGTDFRVRLPGSSLSVGEYVLRVVVSSPKASEPYVAQTTLRKLAPAPNGHEWRIDENGVLRHNGQPYLPFGWFGIPPSEMARPGSPYTAMQAYNTQYLSVERARAFLDEVAAAGSYVLIYPYPSDSMMQAWGKPLSEEEARALAERVRALKDHPAILGWYMADEPELRPALPERLRRVREVIAAEDPYHPCVMLNDTIAGIHQYAEGGDVLMPDPYPCFLQGGLAAQPIEKVSAFIRACREASGGRKAIWITPQAFNYADYGRKGQRGPTFLELRNMASQAVVYGATGFLWYTYSHAGNYPHIGLGIPFLAREMQALRAFVLSPDVPDAVSAKAPQPEHLHFSLRRAGTEYLLVAVNTATQAQRATFNVPRPMARDLFVVSEGRRVPAASG
ncbi:MAG: hypothetical protein QHJ73_18270, partial [Armatimonadota bacterium]|nr:hypothetical protein [Armatimonadota bacterium]